MSAMSKLDLSPTVPEYIERPQRTTGGWDRELITTFPGTSGTRPKRRRTRSRHYRSMTQPDPDEARRRAQEKRDRKRKKRLTEGR